MVLILKTLLSRFEFPRDHWSLSFYCCYVRFVWRRRKYWIFLFLASGKFSSISFIESKLKILSRARIPSFPNRFIWLNVNAPLTHFWSIFPFYNLEKPNTPQTLKKRCEICSKLTMKTPERRLVFLLSTLNIFHTFFSVSGILGFWRV